MNYRPSLKSVIQYYLWYVKQVHLPCVHGSRQMYAFDSRIYSSVVTGLQVNKDNPQYWADTFHWNVTHTTIDQSNTEI
jgi:hypothetical protein